MTSSSKIFNVLLIDPGYSEFAWNQTLTPPIGLLYLSSSLKNCTFCDTSNIDVKIISMNFLKSIGMDSRIESYLDGFVPNIVGISCLASNLHLCANISQFIRKMYPQCLVVYGGIHPTFAFNDILKTKNADVVVRYEGEKTFSHLVCQYLLYGLDGLSNLDGIAFIDNSGNLILNRSRELINDLDILPFPNREEVPYQIYRDINEYKANGIITSRGCPFVCQYCTSKLFWISKYRRRSALNVFKEIRYLKEKYNIRYMTFEDDIFTYDRGYVIELCYMLIDCMSDIHWYAKTRIDCIDDDLLRIMSAAGMRRILLGFETLNQDSLNCNDRNMKNNCYEDIIKLCHSYGIQVTATIILGLPTDTKQDMFDTINYLDSKLIDGDRLIRCLYVPFHSIYSNEIYTDFYLHTKDFRYFTMDFPITSSLKHTLEELTEAKIFADLSMIRRKVRPGAPPS